PRLPRIEVWPRSVPFVSFSASYEFPGEDMGWDLAAWAWANRHVGPRCYFLAVPLEDRVAGFVVPDLFHWGEIASGRAHHRRVHGHGPWCANLLSISQSQNGHRHAGGRERFDVQRTRAGADRTDGRGPRRRSHCGGNWHHAGDRTNRRAADIG